MDATRLYDPIQIRSLTIRNRLWISPMCQYSAVNQDGMTSDWHVVHYGVMARGGAGLVMVEATGVTAQGRISPLCLGIWSDDHVAGFRRIVDFAHTQGAAIGIQLAHAGRKASTYPWMPNATAGSVPLGDGGWETVAPSAVAFDTLREPRALSVSDIDELVSAFVAAAHRAVAAGFDVLEIHSAHGYLLHEFLSPLSNLRNDDFGGSLENRARLLRRVVTSVRADFSNIPIFVRISATDWVDGGFTVEDAATVSGWLREDGADVIDVSSGGNSADASIPVRSSYQVPLAEHIKRTSGALVAAVGLITNPAQAESIITTQQADAVFVARAALRDPQLGLNWAASVHEKHPPVPDQLWRGYPG
jgi:2,4-dienoyl-CoA reductase-like NADH-dependent reductase (Old Yellow Enzyme family)